MANGLPWLFPASRKRGGELKPISSANWLKRVLKPACDQLGLDVDLRISGGFATMASGRGASLKDIQQQLRQGSVNTIANVYVQPVDERVRGVVEEVDRLFRPIPAPPKMAKKRLGHPEDFGGTRQVLSNLGGRAGTRTPDLLRVKQAL